jgi:hypothetical protein
MIKLIEDLSKQKKRIKHISAINKQQPAFTYILNKMTNIA